FIYEVYYKNSNAGFVFRNAASEKKWCITAVLMPVLICLFYIFFTKGTFEKGNLTYKEIIDVVTISILSSGIKAAVTEEIVFRGMILRLLQNTFGKKCAVFVSSL
ncbi:CPBP family intramembrane glutamic endopeptidase, partial [Blautia wexlerae]|uniref:CPBP family intramembrane glutamic endopeptidase n=1 Tax=Blautia wexlerae TaxID=418240 RepID=UPI00325B9BE8